MCAQVLFRRPGCLNLIVSEIVSVMMMKVSKVGGEKRNYERIFKEARIIIGVEKFVMNSRCINNLAEV